MVCCSGELQTAVLEAPDASPAHLANRAALARRAKLWMGDEAATVVDRLEGEDDPVRAAVVHGRC